MSDQPHDEAEDQTSILDESEIPQSPKRVSRRLSAADALVTVALDDVLTLQARRQLRNARRLAVVVGVPSKGWVAAVTRHLLEMSRMPTTDFSRDGSERLKHISSEGNDAVSSALAAGERVIGVSQSPERMLPEALTTSADLRLSIPAPKAAVVAKAMKLCLRGRLSKQPVTDADVAGLDFSDLVAAMRKGSSRREALVRLRAAVAAQSPATNRRKLPTLEEATFYGEARDWGLRLKSDLNALRSGELADFSGIDKGACFYGPPGTGKSYLAMILADSLGIPLIATSVAELFATSAGFLDSVIKAQRKVFEAALARAPSLLFIDELEAMPNRATLSPRGRDWWMPVIDDFLLLLDGAMSSRNGVICIAATNRIQDIDVALLRPGRLERAIEVRAPSDAFGLAQVMRFHLGDDLVDADLVPVAEVGVGATAAEAMLWVRGARRRARNARRPMAPADLMAEIAPPDSRSAADLRRCAVHEAAHAVVALALGMGPLGLVTLVQRPGTGGLMQLAGANEPTLLTRAAIEGFAVIALAGRAGEAAFFSHVSAGAGGSAASDLAMATRLIGSIHATYGLGESLVFRAPLDGLDDLLRLDPDVLRVVEKELKRLLQTAEALVAEHRSEIDALARALIERRHLTGAQVQDILDGMSSPIGRRTRRAGRGPDRSP